MPPNDDRRQTTRDSEHAIIGITASQPTAGGDGVVPSALEHGPISPARKARLIGIRAAGVDGYAMPSANCAADAKRIAQRLGHISGEPLIFNDRSARRFDFLTGTEVEEA